MNLTVPDIVAPVQTIEHFPSLHEWRLERGEDETWQLQEKRTNGTLGIFTDLVFRGGAGSTLEMRLFG